MNTPEKLPATKDGLVQIHWQKIDDRSQTVMVAQGGSFESTMELWEWIQETINRRRSECPTGWEPMFCDATSDYFMRDNINKEIKNDG